MNESNSKRLKLLLPPTIAGIIGDRVLIRRNLSRNSHRVYAVGKDLYLKISQNLEELRHERDTNIWLEGKIPGNIIIPRVGAYDEVFDSENNITYGYLLTTTVYGSPACSPPYKKDPARLCNLLAEAMHIFHSISPVGCPKKNCDDPSSTVIHGDFCLPNIILHRGRVSGFVDLGQVAIGDPWEDYAWCLWSLVYNLKTDAYNQLLLDKLGITFDAEKYKKYIPYEN